MALERPLATLESLGWDESFADSFQAHGAAGRTPARVVAVHKETAIVRGRARGDRPRGGRQRPLPVRRASPSRTTRRSATGSRSSLPETPPTVATGRPSSPPSCRAAARSGARPATPRGAGRAGAPTSRSWPPTSTSRSSSPASTATSTCAGIERYLAVAWSSGVLPVVVLNKADVATDLDGRRAWRSRPSRRACRSSS